jgi:hypothetical protein
VSGVRWFNAIAVISVVGVAISALVGCARGPSALDGTQWRLTEWTLSSLNPRDLEITAEFADGKIGGRGGVNSYGGPYTVGARQSFPIARNATSLLRRSTETVTLRLKSTRPPFRLLKGSAPVPY